jgi:uncharacterized membrane protein YccF (DUF307 family)
MLKVTFGWIFIVLVTSLFISTVPLRQSELETTLCDQVYPFSSTNKTDHHAITEILLKVALNTIT